MRRLLAGVLAGALVGSALAQPPAGGPPAPAGSASGSAATSADVERAKELYTIARKALDEGRYPDAIRDFGAAYEITKDPVMFYWIGNANEKAGRCDVAVIYYGRYLKEGRPSEEFLVTVRQRMTACGGDPDNLGAAPSAGSGSAVAPGGGSAAPGSGSAVAPGGGSAVAPGIGSAVAPGGGSAVAPAADTTDEPAGAGSGSAPTPALRAKHQGPWLLVGGSIAMLTVGVVLAYSANASENDISDLYVGLEGNPPVFDARTKQRYDALVAEGERYEKLSWVSFGLAAGLAGGAAIWFFLSRDDGDERAVIAPTVQPGGAGVSTTIRW